jgi:hypothetical protein
MDAKGHAGARFADSPPHHVPHSTQNARAILPRNRDAQGGQLSGWWVGG